MENTKSKSRYDFKVGDKVKILRKQDHQSDWIHSMDKAIGSIGEVKGHHDTPRYEAVDVFVEGVGTWFYDANVLEKVSEDNYSENDYLGHPIKIGDRVRIVNLEAYIVGYLNGNIGEEFTVDKISSMIHSPSEHPVEGGCFHPHNLVNLSWEETEDAKDMNGNRIQLGDMVRLAECEEDYDHYTVEGKNIGLGFTFVATYVEAVLGSWIYASEKDDHGEDIEFQSEDLEIVEKYDGTKMVNVEKEDPVHLDSEGNVIRKGDNVKVLSRNGGTGNEEGDVGKVTEIEDELVRVTVPGRENRGNFSPGKYLLKVDDVPHRVEEKSHEDDALNYIKGVPTAKESAEAFSKMFAHSGNRSGEDVFSGIFRQKYDAQYHDPVDSPSHYTEGGIETIDFIEAKGLNYRLGNAVKYITRAGKKNDYLEDLRKARWYLDREISKSEDDEG